MKQKVKISACLITYNQEDYIKQCIEGALSQELDFCYEIVIGDDFSTDRTSEICQSYQRRFPVLIKYRKRDKNIGMIGNWIKTISDCSGDYIALCEGDDYWTDPLKLQKQIDFLEANPEYSICFHQVETINSDGKPLEKNTKIVEDTTDILDLAKGNYIHTPSVVFRNDFKIPNWFSNATLGDWTLYLISIGHRKIKFINEIMACYRQHENGIWSMKSDRDKRKGTIETIQVMLRSGYFEKKIERILKAYANELRAQNSTQNYSVFCRKLKRGMNILSSLMSKLFK